MAIRRSTYTIRYSHASGRAIGQYSDFISLNYSLVGNDVGEAHITVIGDRFPKVLKSSSYWLDAWVEIWRGPFGRTEQLEGDTIWLIQSVESYNLNKVLHYDITALDARYLLKGRSIAYQAGSAQGSKNQAADDLMKAAVRENYGSLATDATRIVPSTTLAVEADKTLGAVADIDIYNQELLNVCQDAAQYSASQGKTIYFDVVLADTELRQLEFRTYLGLRGRARNMTFSENKGTLSDVRLVEDYRNYKTFVYAGAKGEKDLQIIGTASDPIALAARQFGRREVYISANNALDQAAANSEAAIALRKYRPIVDLSGSVVDTPDNPYGIAWRAGDQITGEHLGRLFTCNIDMVSVSVSKSSETVQSSVRSVNEL